MTGFEESVSVPLLNLASNLHLVDLLPHVGDGFRACAPAQVCHPVHILDGAQDIVVIDYAIRFVCSQLSACWMVPSCMSSSRFGITHATVGNFAKLVGKLVKG